MASEELENNEAEQTGGDVDGGASSDDSEIHDTDDGSEDGDDASDGDDD